MDLGEVALGSEFANQVGFTEDLFHGYLWRPDENTVTISLITSLKPNQGNVSRFIDGLLQRGFTVDVPSPLGKMGYILKKKGFVEEIRDDVNFGAVDVWTKNGVLVLAE